MKILVIFLFVLLNLNSAHSQSNVLTEDQISQDLDSLFNVLEGAHPNLFARISLSDYMNAKESLYNSVDKQITTLTFFKSLYQFLSKIHDGHIAIYPQRQFMPPADASFLPLRVLVYDDYVKTVYSKQNLEVEPGSLILSINGNDINKIKSRLLSLKCYDLPRFGLAWVEQEFASLYSMEYGFSPEYDLEILNTKGQKEQVKLQGIDFMTFVQSYLPPFYSIQARSEPYSFKILDDINACLFEFNKMQNLDNFITFLKKTFKTLKEKNIEHLIIDIRNNPGGWSVLGDSLLSYLTDKSIQQFSRCFVRISKYVHQSRPEYKSYRINTYLEDKKESKWLHFGDNPLRFKGKVYLLTSRLTYSSAHSLAAMIKGNKIATIIGEETGEDLATYGDVYSFILPNSNFQCTVPVKFYVLPGGSDNPVGHGVIPDINILPDAKDLEEGRDTVLENLKELIRNHKI